MSTDIEYNNVDFIPGGADYPDRWTAEAKAYRETEAAIGRARLNVAFGPGERQKLDMFHPAGKPEGLVVFVHGGYWLRFDRGFWSHFAAGLTAACWAVGRSKNRILTSVKRPSARTSASIATSGETAFPNCGSTSCYTVIFLTLLLQTSCR